MAKTKNEHLAGVLREFEMMAKTLRNDVRRAARGSVLTTQLERAARVLRKRAALVAGQVEKYAHELRLELTKPARKPVRRRTAGRAS